MASVTGMTVAAIEALLDTMVVSLDVNEDGDLIYTKRGGATVNAGPIVAPSLATDEAWPVGSIYTNVVPTSPTTLLGVGTWVRFGQGRVLVSQDNAQTEFNAAEETGGAKTHTLSSAELPVHSHNIAHTHNMIASYSRVEANSGSGADRVSTIYLNNTGEYDINGTTTSQSTSTSGAAGSGDPHNNLQPYIVVYMWKRTA